MATIRKTPNILRNEIKNAIQPLIDQMDLGHDPKSYRTIIEEISLRLAAAGLITLASSLDVKKNPSDLKNEILEGLTLSGIDINPNRKTLDDFVADVNKYGLNFYNNWDVSFDSANITKDESKLLSSYAAEFSDPSYEFTKNDLNLGFRRHTDIQDVIIKNFTLSFYADKNMKIHKIFLYLTNKMKNFKSGMLGYRDDYKFNTIKVAINDAAGRQVLKFAFHNCVFEGLGDTNLIQESSALNLYQVTFDYDYIKIYDEFDSEIE